MAEVPIRDRAGNVLLDVRFVAETDLQHLTAQVPLPAALVVLTDANAVLMLFDSRRRQWELPGGMREPGETTRRTAARELGEETGIHGAVLTFAAVAEFRLIDPARRELLAVYRTELETRPPITLSGEALGVRWWSPGELVSVDMSPLDAEIAARVLGASVA